MRASTIITFSGLRRHEDIRVDANKYWRLQLYQPGSQPRGGRTLCRYST